MDRKLKRILSVLCALALAVAVVGCGGTSSSSDGAYAVQTTNDAYDEYDGYEEAPDEEAQSKSTASLDAPEKMVYSADVSLSSRDFDKATAELDALLAKAGAVTFGDNLWQNEWSDYVSRTRQLNVRVAAEGLDDFADALGSMESAKVTSRNVHASDRTKQYNDSAERIELLRQEYDFYEQTVQETTDPETRLVYTDRMFELLGEIRSLETSNAQIDQDVAYSEVSITLSEDTSMAGRDSSVGLWQQIADAFVLIPQNVGAAFGYLLLFIIEALPALIILALVALIVVLIVRKVRGRRKKTKKSRRASSQAPADTPRPPDAPDLAPQDTATSEPSDPSEG